MREDWPEPLPPPSPEPVAWVPGAPLRWLLAALVPAAVGVYVVLNWGAVAGPASGIVEALGR